MLFVVALVLQSTPRARLVRHAAEEVTEEKPSLSYASKTKFDVGEITSASFVGQYELEEKEDAETSKTLLQLNDDGSLILGATNGIPFTAVKGRWEYDGDALLVELIREYDTYTTSRILIGDVLELDKALPNVEGAIKVGDVVADPAGRIVVDTSPEASVGFFIAVKIPPVAFDDDDDGFL